ncbi:MAG: DinB family protein [Candidatus Eisenbacteria bacterium]|uniref:DinB family protein n=1 Tax=Eiseniibacteriota bacterium TaxID=2212470 RepID=A0A538S783_UNCEI|nr:MAG: DinB family protein [Candidatus Eisenbacteria bacterium]
MDRALRALLIRQLEGGHAYATFADAIRDLPAELRGIKPNGAAHSPWQVLEHMRISQWDIVDFSRDRRHRSPAWPSGYWPQDPEPPDTEAWEASVREFKRELEAMKKLIADPRRDLFAKIDHPEAQAHHTLAREAMVLSEHNGYHTAELITLRRLLGAWSRS